MNLDIPQRSGAGAASHIAPRADQVPPSPFSRGRVRRPPLFPRSAVCRRGIGDGFSGGRLSCCSAIFADGFESGDTPAWSAVVP
ncbi:MAG: hypothetical protein C3F15_01330 [Holophagae bacterium]|nr:MAG: hypothetical protein C3F15_01330 [Holophagae bacterium]